MLFELRRAIRFDGVMSAVVRARCDLIDKQCSLPVEEHLHGRDRGQFELPGNSHGEIFRSACGIGIQIGRSDEVIDEIGILPDDHLVLQFSHLSTNRRRILLRGTGPESTHIVSRMSTVKLNTNPALPASVEESDGTAGD